MAVHSGGIFGKGRAADNGSSGRKDRVGRPIPNQHLTGTELRTIFGYIKLPHCICSL